MVVEECGEGERGGVGGAAGCVVGVEEEGLRVGEEGEVDDTEEDVEGSVVGGEGSGMARKLVMVDG